jgi:hypothetical protein
VPILPEALSLGSTLPLIMSGANSVASLPLGRDAAHPMPLDRPKVADAFASLYQGDSAIDAAFKQARLPAANS